jgi:hypothetical protein
MLGREGELEAAGGLIGEPSSRRLGDVRRMIVKDQVDGRMGWIGRVEKLEKLDELRAAMAILDQSVNLTGQQIDAGQQTDRAVALVLILAREGRVDSWHRRQIGCRRCDGLNTWLLVVGDDSHCVAWLLARCGRGLLQKFDLAINAQHFGHLFRKVGIAAFQVVTHFVRVDILPVKDLADRALGQPGKARMPCASPCSRAWLAKLSSKVRADNPIPLPSGTPTTPAMSWPQG